MTARDGADQAGWLDQVLLALRRIVQLVGRSFGRVAANYAAHHRKVVQTLTCSDRSSSAEDRACGCARSLCQHHYRFFLELVAAPPVHDQLGGMIKVWAPSTHRIGDDPTAGGPVGDPYPAKRPFHRVRRLHP